MDIDFLDLLMAQDIKIREEFRENYSLLSRQSAESTVDGSQVSVELDLSNDHKVVEYGVYDERIN